MAEHGGWAPGQDPPTPRGCNVPGTTTPARRTPEVLASLKDLSIYLAQSKDEKTFRNTFWVLGKNDLVSYPQTKEERVKDLTKQMLRFKGSAIS